MNQHSNRQSFLGPDSDSILSGSRVAIVGLCGGGSHVAQQLAHVGVGDFLLIDPDVVEPPNLNRMIGSRPGDAERRRAKTAVIRRAIAAIAPNARVKAITSRWEYAAEWLRDRTAVFGCVDSFAARSELESYCRRYLLPLLDVGMDVTTTGNAHCISGQVIVSLPGGPCMRCFGYLSESVLAEEARLYGYAGGRPQVVWPNGVLASIAVGQFVRLVTPWHSEPLRPYLEYDGNRQLVIENTTRLPGKGSPCPHYSPLDVGDPFWPEQPASLHSRKSLFTVLRAL